VNAADQIDEAALGGRQIASFPLTNGAFRGMNSV
jgi:hypothetical protein